MVLLLNSVQRVVLAAVIADVCCVERRYFVVAGVGATGSGGHGGEAEDLFGFLDGGDGAVEGPADLGDPRHERGVARGQLAAAQVEVVLEAVRALPPNVIAIAAKSRFAWPIAIPCHTDPGGSFRRVCNRLSAVAAIPPRTPITMPNCSGSVSRPSSSSRIAASTCPVS